MVRKEITFGLQGGLQREAATDLIRCAVTFSSRLLIGKGEREANAKSLLGVLSLGIREGDVITIRGLGKCVVAQVGGQSKKGRTIIVLHRFL